MKHKLRFIKPDTQNGSLKKLEDVLIHGYLNLKHVVKFNSSKFCSTRLA
jgi:hypothetical protein